jgi:hypothetical protein
MDGKKWKPSHLVFRQTALAPAHALLALPVLAWLPALQADEPLGAVPADALRAKQRMAHPVLPPAVSLSFSGNQRPSSRANRRATGWRQRKPANDLSVVPYAFATMVHLLLKFVNRKTGGLNDYDLKNRMTFL